MTLTDAKAYVIVAIITLLGTIFSVVWSTSSATDGKKDLLDTIEQINANQKEMSKEIGALRTELAYLKGMHSAEARVASRQTPFKLPEIGLKSQREQAAMELNALGAVGAVGTKSE